MSSYVAAPLTASVPRPSLVTKNRMIPGTLRRVRRRAVRIEGQIVREADFWQVGSRIVDISELGMFIATTSQVEIGDRMIVAFMAPFTRTWIDAEAIVTRVASGRRRTDKMGGAGLALTDLSKASRALLLEQLKGLPPPLPTTR